MLGRHVPQLAFLDVLLGNEPHWRRRNSFTSGCSSGDPNEATERAEEYLQTHALVTYYDEVAIPALALAEQDRADGRLADEQRARVADSAMVLIDNLAEWEAGGQAADEEERIQAEAQGVDLERSAGRSDHLRRSARQP